MGLAPLLSLPQTHAKSTTGIIPANRVVFTGQTAGPAFQAALPGKNNLLLFQDIILDWTDIETGFVLACLA
jgi:hypothetical protein